MQPRFTPAEQILLDRAGEWYVIGVCAETDEVRRLAYNVEVLFLKAAGFKYCRTCQTWYPRDDAMYHIMDC